MTNHAWFSFVCSLPDSSLLPPPPPLFRPRLYPTVPTCVSSPSFRPFLRFFALASSSDSFARILIFRICLSNGVLISYSNARAFYVLPYERRKLNPASVMSCLCYKMFNVPTIFVFPTIPHVYLALSCFCVTIFVEEMKSFFSTAIIIERFDVSSLLVFHFFAFFSFFTRSQLFATQRVNRAQHSMSELKSEDKSGSCDKWRTHVPSLYVYYLCPPRRSTSSLENVLCRLNIHSLPRSFAYICSS